MKKKFYSLYCTVVPCESFVSDFFIVEKTFAFYENFLFSEEKTFAIFRITIFEGRNFCENGQKSRKSRKFLPAKISAPKVFDISKYHTMSIDDYINMTYTIKYKLTNFHLLPLWKSFLSPPSATMDLHLELKALL